MSLIRLKKIKMPIISAKTLAELRGSLREARKTVGNAFPIIEFSSFNEKYGVFYDCKKKVYCLVGFENEKPVVDLALSTKLVDLFDVVGDL